MIDEDGNMDEDNEISKEEDYDEHDPNDGTIKSPSKMKKKPTHKKMIDIEGENDDENLGN